MRIITLIFAALILSSCNVMEGLRQTGPNNGGPVIFSDNWYRKREEKKELKRWTEMQEAAAKSNWVPE